jgi:hypothetical protein
MAGHDAIAGDELLLHPEVAAPMRDELVDLEARARVKELIDPLARRELARRMLAVAAVLSAPKLCQALVFCQLLTFVHKC